MARVDEPTGKLTHEVCGGYARAHSSRMSPGSGGEMACGHLKLKKILDVKTRSQSGSL